MAATMLAVPVENMSTGRRVNGTPTLRAPRRRREGRRRLPAAGKRGLGHRQPRTGDREGGGSSGDGNHEVVGVEELAGEANARWGRWRRRQPASCVSGSSEFEQSGRVRKVWVWYRANGGAIAAICAHAASRSSRVERLYGPCQWFHQGTDDPADGPSSEWFSQCYRDANGTDSPYPAAAAFAAGVVWQRCVKEAGTAESLPVLAASQRLDTTTLFGRFRVDPVTGVQTGHQIRVVQWRDGQRVLVDRLPRRT